jgi:hypothetical protein
MAAPAARVAALQATGSSPVHRAMLRLPVDRRGLAVGLAIAFLVMAAALTFARPFWRLEAAGIDGLLRFAGTQHQIQPAPPASHLGGLRSGGPRIGVPVDRTEIPRGVAAIVTVALAAATIGVLRWKKVPLPFRVLWLAAAIIGVVSVLYSAASATGPPHPVDRLVVDFQSSGLLIMVVASLLFAFEVFPIPGPVLVKAGWLIGLFAFAALWSVVRMSVSLASAARFGSWPFLFLHYIGGIYVDFLYVVAFYSFATQALAKKSLGGRHS